MRRGPLSTTPRWGRTNRLRPALSRTTRVAGSTTATSSPIRTRGWRAGTWWSRKKEVTIHNSLRFAPAALLAAALLVPAGASAQTYPEPKDPGKVEPKPKGPHHTLTVCHKKTCDFRSIQKAVNKPRAGDTIRVRNGVYHEAVKVQGRNKRYLKMIGNPGHPKKVRLEGKHTKNPQNAFFVNDADQVTIDGFFARNYKANGFFVTNLNGYTLNHLIAGKTGAYGLYAFNAIGGRMLNSEGYYNN